MGAFFSDYIVPNTDVGRASNTQSVDHILQAIRNHFRRQPQPDVPMRELDQRLENDPRDEVSFFIYDNIIWLTSDDIDACHSELCSKSIQYQSILIDDSHA